jgi:hypothetical protein
MRLDISRLALVEPVRFHGSGNGVACARTDISFGIVRLHVCTLWKAIERLPLSSHSCSLRWDFG